MRRASAGITPVRAAALLALLAGLAGMYGVSSSSAFAARQIDITGATWTPQAEILRALAIPSGQNLFTVNSAALADRLASIPGEPIRSARVSVGLPDVVAVSVTEREPLVVWRVGDIAYLVDETGLLFSQLGASPPPAASSLPVITDQRAAAQALAVGSTLDPVTLDAALRLGSLTPADLASAATGLAITVDDANGFTVSRVPAGWQAVFGFYTPTLRTTDLIPGQVRLLRSLLSGREAKVGRVILADDRSGTYLPRGTARPSASPRPTSRPASTARPRATAAARPTAQPVPTATPKP